ncbi:alpha/beta fold hydrolase [Roseomonas sp. HF4]|uniref:alpha/beta fold hydrolase n=1 Tax=Roseomonas sp. HF4 TaxID=2562313 RepID=UPI001485395E|nr:alpha/beta fold hydrolase [Roseomonas sp. HF4]
MAEAIPPQATGPIRIDGFIIDPARAELRQEGGGYVPLRPRSFAVLGLLAANLGRVVGRDHLLAAVWNDAAVTEDALTQCIADIRRAIGDEERQLLRTIPRRGYMLLPAREVQDGTLPAPAPVRRLPETRYARSGDCHIAYQVTGEGPVDLVFAQGYVTHLEIEWEDPRPARFIDGLSSFCRLIRFDKRGTGLSDRVAGLATLEERMDDLRAVMDAAGSERAVLLGASEGGPMSLLFSATCPERVRSLILCGAFARIAAAPDHPWGRTPEQLANILRMIEQKWGTGHSVDAYSPSLAADPAYRDWRGRMDRAGASPGAALSLLRMNFGIDVRHILPTIAVPTLVLHRARDNAIDVEHGRHLARSIPGARYVELAGRDHPPWTGDTDAVVAAIRDFVVASHPLPEPDRVVATVLAAVPGVDMAAVSEAFRAIFRREVALHRGREAETRGPGCMAVFDGPARAVRCGHAIIAAARASGADAHIGVHTGECERVGPSIRGIAMHLAGRIAEVARPGEVLVSSTIRDLVAGSGLSFAPRSERAFSGLPGRWTLLTAS